MENNNIEQPGLDLQEKLNDLYEEKPTEVMFCGKKVKVGWMHNGTNRKFSNVMAEEKDVEKRHAKLAAIVLLNDWLKIKLIYWIMWRWLYYVKDIDVIEVLKLLEVAKKKVQQEPFYLTIILSTGMTDMMMTMTSREAERIRAEQLGAQRTR